MSEEHIDLIRNCDLKSVGVVVFYTKFISSEEINKYDD